MHKEEYYQLGRDLEKHHAIFYMMWQLGVPQFSESVNTAAIGYDLQGNQINFLINENFWKECSNEQKKFLIAHECLHVIYDHIFRFNDVIKDPIKMQVANIAMDYVVNETLINSFHFQKDQIDPDNRFVWQDKIEKLLGITIYSPLSEEECYAMLEKEVESFTGGCGVTVDDHSGLFGEDSQDANDAMQDAIARYMEQNMSEEEMRDLREQLNMKEKPSQCRMAGTVAGSLTYMANTKKIIKKKKWETVIKKWSMSAIKTDLESVEQWSRKNRRFYSVMKSNSKLFMPTEVDDEKFQKDRIQVWFFQDTSGSCYEFRDRFFKAAKTLPEDKFDIKMFCFDTEVYETSIQSGKLYGFGGTSFSVLERYIQAHIQKNKLQYPKAVFVITDGYGDHINMVHPERWYWFLSHNYNYYIPKECNIFNLQDFE